MNEQTSPAEADLPDRTDVDVLALVEIVAKRIRFLVLAPLVVGLLTFLGLFFVAPIYTARTVVLLPTGSQSSAATLLQSLGSVGGAVGATVGIKNPADQIVSMVKSRTLLDRLVVRFDLKKVYGVDFLQEARTALEGDIRASAGKDGLITIEVEDKDPKRAMQIANAIPEELTRLLGDLAMSEAQQRRRFFEGQLFDVKEQLVKAEAALKAGGIDGDSFKSNPQAAVSAVAQLQAQIAVQEVRMGALRGYMTENAPDYKQALVELSALRTQLAKLEANQNVKGEVQTPGDYVQRFRNFKYYETLFDLLSRQYEVARLNESQGGTVIQVLDLAVEPEKKTKPKTATVVVWVTLITALALLLYVFAAHSMRAFRSSPENEARLRSIVAMIRGQKA